MPLSPFQQGALAALRTLHEQLIAERTMIENHPSKTEMEIILELLDVTVRFYEAFDSDDPE